MKDLIIWVIVISFIVAQIPIINNMFDTLNSTLEQVTSNTIISTNLHSSLIALAHNPFNDHLVIYLIVKLFFRYVG